MIGLLSSFVLGSYFISASDRRRRQLIMLYTTWAALSSGSLWLTVLGEFDRLMLVGLANVAAMLGSLGLTMTGISPTRRWNVSVGVSAFVLFGGSLIYLCEFSPYRAPVARIQGNYVLDYATWDSIDALLLVDWRHGRTVSLWVAPDATYELDRRIHLAPDERHVAFRVQRRGNSLEWHPSGWLVVCLRPPVRAPRRFPIPGFFSSFFDDMTHPALGSQGIWLDSRHLSLVRRKFKMGVADYIKELELCQLFTD